MCASGWRLFGSKTAQSRREVALASDRYSQERLARAKSCTGTSPERMVRRISLNRTIGSDR